MNDDQNPSEISDATAKLKHEKIIAPINPGVRPEAPPVSASPVTVLPANDSPQQATASVPIQPTYPDIQTPPVSEANYPPPSPVINDTRTAQAAESIGDTNNTRHQLAKILRLIVSGIIGGLVGASYFQFWENTVIGNLTILVTEQHSPFVVRHTFLPMIVLIVVYALLHKFLLRSKHSFGQAVFATLATLILVVGILALNHRESINIFGSGVNALFYLSGAVGAGVFAAASYFSEKVWSWKTSRFAVALVALSIITISVFGLGKATNSTLTKVDKAEQEISDKVKQESDAGIYNFSANYQQFFLNETVQDRFIIKDISATNVTQSEEYKSYPHFTYLEFRDKNYTGTNDALTIDMWQSKINPSYDPPASCGHPDPSMEYYDQKSSKPIYKGACYKVGDIPGVGALYGRNEYRFSEADKTNGGIYDWYYVAYKDTLITLDTTGTLSGNDVITLLAGLSPISGADLLAKSKSLALSPN